MVLFTWSIVIIGLVERWKLSSLLQEINMKNLIGEINSEQLQSRGMDTNIRDDFDKAPINWENLTALAGTRN